jgi:hypothetical protein
MTCSVRSPSSCSSRSRPPALVDHRDLGLAVGTQVRDGSDASHLGQALREPVGQPDRQRHQVRCLVAGVPEHHALVPGALGVEGVLAAGSGAELVRGIDSLRDVGRLGVKGHEHAACVAVEPVGVVVVPDLADRLARQRRDVHVSRRRHLAGHHNKTSRQEGLAGDPAGRVALQHGVENGVGNLVRHLVGVTFGH